MALPARQRGRGPGRCWVAGALLVAAVSSVGGAPQAPSAAPLPPLAFTETTLPNGLRVVVHEDHSTPIVNVQVWYHVGWKDEREGLVGLAHLFEHLMFAGSKNVEPGQHAAVIAAIGGQSNAYTTEDATVFWETVPGQHLPMALWLEADRMAALRISGDALARERRVLLEERLMRVENQPYGRITEILYGRAFRVHPYRGAGTVGDLDSVSIGDVRDFYRTYYVPSNATLAIAGDVDARQALELAAAQFGRIPKPERPLTRDIPAEPPARGVRRSTVEEAWPLPVVVVAHHGPRDGHPDAYALQVAAKILSDGRSSRLYRGLVYDTGRAMAAGAVASLTEHPNLFYAFAIVQPGFSASDAIEALGFELDRLRQFPVSEADLARAKRQITRDYVFGRETIQQKAAALAHASLLRGDTASADADFARLQAVTAADVQRVAQACFAPNTRIILTVVPKAAAGEPK